MACPETNTLLEFVEGLLDAPAAEAVELHMDGCPRCRRAVAGMVSSAGEAEATLEPEEGKDRGEGKGKGLELQPGVMVDHYRLVHRLGRGGMGEVFLARDTQLGRRVALKVVRARGRPLGEADLERLLQEARTTARFSHPNIVTIHAVGRHRGCPYLALEHIEGETLLLRAARQTSSFGVAEVLRMGVAVADALAEAHRHGVSHRDLKPANIMLGQDGRLKVLDFGLARVTRSEEGGEPAQREHVGTPAYMAPEQWQARQADGAADVWALGVILFELLSGRRPWDASGPDQQRDLVTTIDAPAVDQFREMPPALSRLVARCLRRDPARRPDAGDLAQELRALFSGDPREAGEVSPFRGLHAFDEEHRYLFFGRDAEIAAVAERLREVTVLPVVGPSGVGKSSFVRAGLVPRLRERGALTVIEMRPGARPLRTLAARLLAAVTPGSEDTPFGSLDSQDSSEEEDPGRRLPSAEDLASRIQEAPQRLNLELLELAHRQQRGVLLLVDQAEELYTLTEDDRERRAFMEAVCGAADLPDAPVRVVLTLRDDFLGRLAESPGARRALSQITVLGQPGSDALLEILTRPVAAVGYTFDDEDLPGEMVDEIQGELSCLPLLQFAGEVLWQRRDRRHNTLRRETYEEMGGVAGALARRADGALAALPPDDVRLARALLLRLATPEGTRRVEARRAVLEGLGERANEVLARLVEARLVTVGHEEGEEPALELAHESLLHAWSRLRRWMEASRGERAAIDELTRAATLWDQRGAPEAEVWRGDNLRDARRTVEQAEQVPDVVSRFLRAGQKRRRAHDRGRRLRWLLVGVALVLVAAGSVAAALVLRAQEREATRQRDRAERQRTAAELQRAAAQRQGAQAQHEAARRAMAQGDMLEARARIRASLELQDSAAARMLWWALKREPLDWKLRLGESVNHVAVSDGRLVAVAAGDRAIYLVDFLTGAARRVLRGHSDQVLAVALDRSGRWLVSGSWDGEVRLWDTTTGKGRRLGRGPRAGAAVYGVAISLDGKWVAAGGRDRLVRIWDRASGKVVHTLQGHTGSVMDVAFAPAGQTLATCAKDRSVRLWRASTGQVIRSLPRHHPDEVLSLGFSKDGRWLASGALDGSVRLWDRTQKRASTLGRLPSGATSVSFRNDGQRLAVASMDGTVRVLKVPGGKEMHRLRGHGDTVWSVSYYVQWLISGGVDRTVRRWFPPRARRDTIAPHGAAVQGLDFSPDGRLLASSSRDHTVLLWDTRTGRRVRALRGHSGVVRGVRFSPDGKVLATGSYDGTIRLWEVATGAQRVFQGTGEQIWDVSFSPDGKLLASGGKGPARLWDVATGVAVRELTGHSGGVFGPRFSPDGKRLATGGYDRTVRVWDVATGKQVAKLSEHQATVYDVAFSPDGKLVASGSSDGTVRLWDTARGRVRILARDQGRVTSVDFAPDGASVASAASDGGIRTWATVAGARSLERAAKIPARVVRFSPRGQSLATGGGQGAVRLWHTSSGLPVWRTSLLVGSPPRILTHLGWIVPAVARGQNPGLAKAAWQGAAASAVRAAVDRTDRWMCSIDRELMLEVWDLREDRRLFRSTHLKVPPRGRVVALPRGCITLGDGRVVVHDIQIKKERWRRPKRVQTETELAKDATALGLAGEDILVATPAGVTVHPAKGPKRKYSADPGVTALCKAHKGLVLGHAEGNLEYVPTTGTRRTLKSATASAALMLVRGPGDTVVAGHADGTVALWSLTTGHRLRQARLHGPVSHLLLRGARVLVATELGEHHVWDLSLLQQDYCELMGQLWSEVPVSWRDGRAVVTSPPRQHRCRGANRPPR